MAEEVSERILAIAEQDGTFLSPTEAECGIAHRDPSVWPGALGDGAMCAASGAERARRRRGRDGAAEPTVLPVHEPNDLWGIDFKGWLSTLRARCEHADDQRRRPPVSESDAALLRRR